VTTLFTVPILTYTLTNFEHSTRYDTSTVRLVLCDGTSMDPAQIQRINTKFRYAVTCLVYGLTETGLVSMFDIEKDAELAKFNLTSSGKLAPQIRLKIADLSSDQLLGPNERGEICIASPSMMLGYYRGDCTAAFDNNRYLKTGDVGYYDEEGCLYVTDRIKEIFQYQSWHIVPLCIEAVLMEHPAVKDVAVFGISHGKDGEVPAACVVVDRNHIVSAKELDKFVADRVAEVEKLRGGITFMEALPKTPNGKVLRNEVRNFIMNSEKK
jgi:4-coumarate--CoA ligase